MKPEWLINCVFAGALLLLAVNNVRHLVIPDKITIPGITLGLVASWLFPSLQNQADNWLSLGASAAGVCIGTASMYAVREIGKRLFGKQRLVLPAGSKVVFTTDGVVLPDEEILYQDIFYRRSDMIEAEAKVVEFVKTVNDTTASTISGLKDVTILLSPNTLTVGDRTYDPSQIQRVVFYTDEVIFPREFIGMGLVKLMGLVGAFLGWKGAVFTLGCGSLALAASAIILKAAGLGIASLCFEAATPICIAALAWILIGSRLLYAGSIAVVCGTLFSFIHHRLVARKGDS